ncbi:response regulator [Acholeplasma vituli]|uniref:Response regulator n=1 Tax=Paracholeplasma vituli TaxID=69473 RepID=A0ABT2PUZ6_9MOLU|nr:response regulator [Paracholeplasma vituli]MCU0104775.1 response regulator [Paracholeplasma vituli]
MDNQLYVEDFKINFIPIHFLPFPQAFVVYESETKSLISNTLFSSIAVDKPLDPIQLKQGIFAYHKMNLPSSEYIKDPIRRIRQHEIDAICPTYGYIIESNIDNWIEYEYKLDFYNTGQVFKYNEEFVKEFNYIEIINHMINQLNKSVDTEEIIETFSKSEFILSEKPLEMVDSTHVGYKLWHAFFEYVYAKKGTVWLTILEPLILRYHNIFGLSLPAIYVSQMREVTEQKEVLERDKKTLEQNLEKLEAQIEETKDALLRCPITKLYIEEVFRGLLKKEMEHAAFRETEQGFILIQLDQLFDINKRYGKETGDEAIRNLAYIIGQVVPEGTRIFKQNGPGILVHTTTDKKSHIIDLAVRIRNAVKDATFFIEKVTVCASIVYFSELNPVLTDDNRIKEIFIFLDQRMRLARQTGFGEVIDNSTALPTLREGIILLVDEDEMNRNMLVRVFNRLNFDVKAVTNVTDALAVLREYPIDIVISEINLSKMDGFSLKRELNESKTYANIPFIMVSHNKTVENIRRGNMLNVDLIIEKPIIPEELIGHVKRFRERR